MSDEPAKKRFPVARLLPLLVLIAGLVAFFAFGLNRYIDLDLLKENRQVLANWVAEHPFVAPLVFIAAYIAVAAFSLPIATLMSVAGGFLFGWFWGAAWIVIGATIGASLVFLAVKFGLADALRARSGDAVKRMEKGFQDNAFSYLLFLRFVPLFPFFIVNIVPGLLGVRLSTFVVATFIGIIPGAVVYALFGDGIGKVFDAGGTPDFSTVLKPELIAALVGLAIFALVPVIYRKFFANRKAA